MNFFAYEPQSQKLAAANVILPPNLSDENLLNPNEVELSLRRAKRYRDDVNKEFRQGNATAQDLNNAEKGLTSIGIASNMPSIERNLAPVAAAAIAQAVVQLLAPRFDHIDARFEDMRISQLNSTAVKNDDTIVPKLQLLPIPVVGAPQAGPPLPVPPNFPATRIDLFRLTRARVDTFLVYYGIQVDPQTALPQRCNILARYLGVVV